MTPFPTRLGSNFQGPGAVKGADFQRTHVSAPASALHGVTPEVDGSPSAVRTAEMRREMACWGRDAQPFLSFLRFAS